MADKTHIIRIAITAEEISPAEPAVITEILEAGWDMVHLRHPAASTTEMRRLIEAVPRRFHSRLRLHGHFCLIDSFNLGGVHLNRRCPSLPAGYSGPYSRSCHSLQELHEARGCDYVTLSPIFDSISKPGYKSRFDKKTLTSPDLNGLSCVNTKVIALGGITPATAPKAIAMGFDGYAALGYLMSAPDTDTLRHRLAEFETSGKHENI